MANLFLPCVFYSSTQVRVCTWLYTWHKPTSAFALTIRDPTSVSTAWSVISFRAVPAKIRALPMDDNRFFSKGGGGFQLTLMVFCQYLFPRWVVVGYSADWIPLWWASFLKCIVSLIQEYKIQCWQSHCFCIVNDIKAVDLGINISFTVTLVIRGNSGDYGAKKLSLEQPLEKNIISPGQLCQK